LILVATLLVYIFQNYCPEGAREGRVFRRGRDKNMQNRQIDKKTTKQVRISVDLHKKLKVKSAKEGMTIKAFLEYYIAELLSVSPPDSKN